MPNQWLDRLKTGADPPFLYSAAQFGYLLGIREKSALQLFGVVSETGLDKGIKALITENERAAQYGFTAGELEREKKQFYSSYENAYKERDKTESAQLAAEYIRNYLTDEPIPGIEYEFNFVKTYLDSISLDEVNLLAQKMIKKVHPCRDSYLAPQKKASPCRMKHRFWQLWMQLPKPNWNLTRTRRRAASSWLKNPRKEGSCFRKRMMPWE